jgi:hypothetical protein
MAKKIKPIAVQWYWRGDPAKWIAFDKDVNDNLEVCLHVSYH